MIQGTSGHARLPVTRRVAVRLGEPVQFPSRLSLPMIWEPGGWLLPKLHAELELGPLGQGRTQLAISGRHEPLLGVVATVLQAAGPSLNGRTPHPASV
jgi:hypothetical protein